jgi:S1-C subfamily serine protease
MSLLALLCAGTVLAADGAPPKEVLALEQAFQAAIQQAEPSIVCIAVARSPDRTVRLDNPDTVPESFGSGVVVGVEDGRGLILTNFHVVPRADDQIYVRLPGGRGSYAAHHAGDQRSDLAVLKLRDSLPVKAIKLGDGDNVRKGQLVLSIANPFAAGFRDGSPSASWGIISNVRRRPAKPAAREQDRNRLTLDQYGILLQTDARLNLGCSGGALVDLKGELIGLTTAQAALSGSETAGGFAIPMSSAIRGIIRKLMKGERVEYGFLGVSFGSPFGRVSGEGVRIDTVIRGSPAERAGLRPDSVILAVNGVPVREPEDLFMVIGTLLAGSEAQLRIRGRNQPLTVTLAKFYYPGPVIAVNQPAPVRGLRVEYTSVLMQRTNRGEIPSGVYAYEVQPGSPAEAARLLDAVITHVNGIEVNTPAEFYREAAKHGGPLELTVANRSEKAKLD